MAAGSFFWHVVLPVASTNLEDNPSFELGTANWTGTATATLGTSSASQAFGAWALTATGATDGLGATTTTASLGSGSAVTASAYVRITGATGGSAQIGIGGTTFRTPVGSAWTRIAVGTVQTATATRTLAVQRYNAASGTLWVDGVQAEYGSITSYIDGDQEGCQWLGQPHASTSSRSGQSRAGGSVVPLAVLGLRAETSPGMGFAPVVNVSQPRAVLPGAEYQRTRADVRELTITATLTGTTTEDLHITRRRLGDVFKVDRVTPQAPTRFYYTGATGTVQLDAVYAGGLEANDMAVVSEQAAVRFTAFDPLWRDVLDEGTALAPQVALGSVNYIAWRDPIGRWGTFGANGTTVNSGVYTINTERLGTLVVGGNFSTAGGTSTAAIARYSNGAWGTFGGGVTGGIVYATKWNAALSTLYVGGDILAIGGTSTLGIGFWNGAAFGTLGPGSLSGGGFQDVYRIQFAPDGALIAVGDFLLANGTASPGIARYSNGAWGTLSGGTIGQRAYAAAQFAGGNLAVGGLFSLAGGTTVTNFAIYDFTNSAWGTYAVNISEVEQLAISSTQDLYAQTFGTIYRLRPGGAQVLAGVTQASLSKGEGALLPLPDGRVVAGQVARLYTTITDILGYAIWNGYSWTFPDLYVAALTPGLQNAVNALAIDSLGTLYVGGGWSGQGTAAYVGSVVNTGMTEAYPVLRVRNTGAGTARLYQFLNTTTNDAISFNLITYPGEYLTLNLTPGNRAFTSSTRGNMVSSILGGSNLATWRLLPGTNWLSFFASDANVRAEVFWRPRHWAVDGGADPSV